VSPIAGHRTDFVDIPMDLQRFEICIKFSRSVGVAATQPADMEGGDCMFIWLISIAGVIGGVIATETPITDPKVKLLLGLVLMGVVIHIQCGSGKGG